MPQVISGACGLNWREKNVAKDLQPSFTAHDPYKNTAVNLVMKLAAPHVVRATWLSDQLRQRIRYKHYSLRTK
jgi:hypothetical protein